MSHVAYFKIQKDCLLKEHINAVGPVDPIMWEEAMLEHFHRMDVMEKLHKRNSDLQCQETEVTTGELIAERFYG